MRILTSARARAVVVITALLLILGMTTTVGLLRTADHKSEVELLQSASTASAALEHARGEFLNATNSLAALGLTKDASYFLKYEQSRQTALNDLALARSLAASRGEAKDLTLLDGLMAQVNEFDQAVSAVAQAYLAGDAAAATQNQAKLSDTATEIVASLGTAASHERQVVAEQTAGTSDALNVTLALQLALGALAIAIGVTAAGTLVISVIRPLASLRASARAIAGGDLNARAVVSGPAEVRSLARAFNQMTESVVSRTRELEQSVQERLKAEERLRLANESLEQRVRERTERLTRLNAKLEEEIAERKKAERALQRSEEYFRSLIEKSSDIILIVDVDGNIRYASPSLERTLGYAPAEVEDTSAFALVHPNDLPQAMRGFSRTVEGENGDGAIEVRVRHADGSWRIIEALSGRIAAASGSPAILINCRDVTERRRAEDSLRASEERYRMLFERNLAGVYQTTVGGRILACNDSLAHMMGYESAPQLLASSALDRYMNREDRENFLRLLQETGSVTNFEICLTRRDGSAVWVLENASLMRGESGSWEDAVIEGTIIDITERRRAEETARRLAAIVESSDDAIVGTNTEGIVTDWNSGAEAIYGYAAEEIIGKDVSILVPPECLSELEEIQTKLGNGDGVQHHETVRLRKDGAHINVSLTVSPVRDASGRVTGVSAIARDITKRKQAEERLVRLSEAVRTSIDSIVVSDVSGRIIEINDASLSLYGARDRSDLLGTNVFELVVPEERARAMTGMREVLEKGHVPAREFTVVSGNGNRTPVEISLSVIRNGRGEPIGFVGISRDITERRRAEETIRHLAYHDSLTGLPNRELFKDRLTQALARARRGNGMLAVMFLDLDEFKDVNDTVGHAEGDKLLDQVALRLRHLVRESDTVARLGGDEFTVLLPEISGADEATEVAERILGGLKHPWTVSGHEFHVSGSIGITVHPADGGDAETLLRNADTAMYQAKELGRDRYQLYTAVMNTRIAERLALENAIRRGVDRGEFVLHYQPQVELCSGRVVGAEALLRWRRPERGLVQPAEFISTAEKSGLIVPLGEWVLRQACCDARSWQGDGNDLRIAVNLSPRQFEQHELTEMVSRAMRDAGLDPRRLQIEITEGAAMRDVDYTIETLHRLREMGIQIAIDDFGTGHSSLNYLKKFPIDAVKIDCSFIRDVTTDPTSAALVIAIIGIGHSLGLNVIAEGVETEEQAAFLREPRGYMTSVEGLQCDEFQGYLFSEPVPARQFEKMISRGRRKAATTGLTSTGRA